MLIRGVSTGSYYAVQHAMTLGSKAPESNLYLFSLMDKLEVVGQYLPVIQASLNLTVSC